MGLVYFTTQSTVRICKSIQDFLDKISFVQQGIYIDILFIQHRKCRTQ